MVIEKLCRRIFNNQPDDKLFSKYPFFCFLIADLYLPYCNSENGDYLNLLVEGGIMGQPYVTYKILDLIKLNYKIYIQEAQEKRAKELKLKQARGRRR